MRTATIWARMSSRSLEAFEARAAAQLQPPDRRPEHRILERAGRRLHPGRHQDSQEPDGDRWRPRTKRRRTCRTSSTSRRAPASRGRRSRAARRRSAAAGACSTTGCRPALRQTLQIDGFRLREINIVNPSFPDTGRRRTSTTPTNRYLLAEERDMAYSQRLSAGIAQTISRRISTNMLYSYSYRLFAADRPQSQHADQWRAARPRLRQRRAGHVRLARPAAHDERVGEPQPGAAAANGRARGARGRWRR